MTDNQPGAPGLEGPPWEAPGTVYSWGGFLSNFASTPGLRLPSGYYGHHEADEMPVKTVEHWFQACKATSRQDFDSVLCAPSAAAAKAGGRKIELRPDWEQVKYQVMVRALGGKFALEPYRSGLLLTNPRALAEDSPHDFIWGCRDADGGYEGDNLLGRALMEIRAGVVAAVREQLGALTGGRRDRR